MSRSERVFWWFFRAMNHGFDLLEALMGNYRFGPTLLIRIRTVLRETWYSLVADYPDPNDET